MIMKALWLCPIMIPEFAEYYGEKKNPKGGWITGLYMSLADDIQIDLCSPAKNCVGWNKNIVNRTTVYTLRRTESLTDTLKEIILSSTPDIIHIWGTEKKMTLDMVNAAEQLNMIDKVVINIQGLVSVISKYHFFCYLPQEVIQSESPAEYKYKVSLKNQQEAMALQGIYEVEALKKVKHVVGRTDWDEACVKQINPHIHYHKCYESLRTSFYDNRWDYDMCEKYSIFLSQSHCPLKGLHLVLEAMPLILKKFPTAKLYTTGRRPKLPETFQEKCSELAYPSYLAQLIKDYKLENSVIFTGFLSETQMCERYLHSNVSVSSSSIENSSNSIAEAMLLGMPIVASAVGGVGDFIEHKENGYLYQSDAPYMLAYYICKVFENSDNAIKMGTRARRSAQKFLDRETNAGKMKEIYTCILNDDGKYL